MYVSCAKTDHGNLTRGFYTGARRSGPATAMRERAQQCRFQKFRWRSNLREGAVLLLYAPLSILHPATKSLHFRVISGAKCPGPLGCRTRGRRHWEIPPELPMDCGFRPGVLQGYLKNTGLPGFCPGTGCAVCHSYRKYEAGELPRQWMGIYCVNFSFIASKKADGT